MPEGGELPPEEELAALEAAEQAEAEAAAAAHAEAIEATEAALAEDLVEDSLEEEPFADELPTEDPPETSGEPESV